MANSFSSRKCRYMTCVSLLHFHTWRWNFKHSFKASGAQQCLVQVLGEVRRADGEDLRLG